MKFATFQSTYKPLPLDVYERTGQELEAKYYRNREQSSLLRQAMANTKVEDRNIGILAKATSDVEGMMDAVDGKWHYASNILYNAKDRLINDKALNASVEDYAKSQAAKANEQKRFEEGKIDQDALSAFYTNEKRYNNKSIQVDENGQVINRWNTPTAPPKVDTEKKVMEIATLLTQHKDSLPAGVKKDGTPLAEIYRANPGLEGYVNRETAKGVDGEKIANAVKAWIASTPEVKQYYNYINDAKVFDAVTRKDETGHYLQDENGNFVQDEITPADFRALGIQVMDDWKTVSDKLPIPGPSGMAVNSVIKGISPNFKKTGLYKQYREAGYSDKETLYQIYKQTLTDLQTDKVVNFARQFGYKEFDTQVIKDEGYWFRMNLAQKKLEEANIYSALQGKSPMLPKESFSTKATRKLITELAEKAAAYDEGSPMWNQYQNEIDNLRTTDKILRNSYINDNPNGAQYVEDLFSKLISRVPRSDRRIFEDNKEKVINYITGKSDTLGFNYDTNKTKNIILNMGIGTGSVKRTLQTQMNDIRSDFNNGFEKAVQEGKINLNINTIDFLDKDGAVSKVGENLGENILSRGDSFINMGALSKQGQPMTLDDYYKEQGIDESKYKPIAQFTDHYGKFVIKFVPRDKTIDPLKDDARLVIEPNPENKDAVMMSMMQLVGDNTTGNSPEVNNWLQTTSNNLLYGKQFNEIENYIAELKSEGIEPNEVDEEFTISNIPLSKKDPSKRGDFVIKFNNDNSIDLFQKDNTDPTRTKMDFRANRYTFEEIQNYLREYYLK